MNDTVALNHGITGSAQNPNGASNEVRAAIEFEQKKPNINALVASFRDNYTWVQPFILQCKRNADTRFCRWPGQNWDQRKHTKDIGVQAMPWEGASDMRFHFIDANIKYLVAMIMAAWRRARVSAYPNNNSLSTVRRASRAASFLKWLFSQIPDLYKQSEIALNYLFNTGICVTYQGWTKKINKIRRCVYLSDFPTEEQLAVLTPEMEGIAVQIAKQYLNSPQFNADWEQDAADKEEDYSDEDIKKIISELRETGKSEIKIESAVEDRGLFRALSPEEDIIFPPSTIDIQDSTYIWQIEYKTPHEMRALVHTDEWDKEFVEHCIKNYQGVDNIFLPAGVRYDSAGINIWEKIRGLVQMVHCWQKVVDDEGNICIYETMFHPSNSELYGFHRLSDFNHGQYPFVVTKFEDFSKRLYEIRGLTEILKGTQENYKAQLDAKIDRTSLTNLPPILEVMNTATSDGAYLAPGTKYRVRSIDEMQWMPVPQADPIGEEVIKELRLHADIVTGRSNDDINPVESQNRLAMIADKWSEHMQKAAKQLWELYKQYGPDEMWFRVGGSNEMAVFKKDHSDSYDFSIALNTQTNDWETLEKKTGLALQLIQQDTTGIADKSKIVAYILNEIDPNLADEVISGQQDAQEQSIKEERDAINSVTSAQDVDVHENDRNQTKAQYYMQWFQRPDVQQRLQADPVVAQIAEKRAKQWQFQLSQIQNATIGKLGTAPGNAGSV